MLDQVRFKRWDELTEQERDELFERYHHRNLAAAEVKSILRDRMWPRLKARGFKRARDSRYFRSQFSPYVHFLEVRFSGKSPGRFFVRAAIALDILPLLDGSPYSPKEICLDTESLLINCVRLPNGNPDFDNGTNRQEAEETVALLMESLESFERDYFGKFTDFPRPLDSIDVHLVEQMNQTLLSNRTPELGGFAATQNRFVHRIALVHKHLGNLDACRTWIQFGRAQRDLGEVMTKLFDQLESDS